MEGQHPSQIIAPHPDAQSTVTGPLPAQSQPDSPSTPAPAAAPVQNTPGDNEAITWEAAEFIDHQKDTNWYFGLAATTVVVAALVFLATRDKISTGVVVIAAIFIGILAARKPKTLAYRIDRTGITVGPKAYDYDQFKSFSIVHEAAGDSIYFVPLRRFRPALTIYYAQDHEDQIVQLLADRLPMEPRQQDPVDRFMSRIRF